ncbi:MAG TPA: glycosyltransferase family 2 protein [Candidatus Paceibacterota bacterium]|nr:glycosyltransferase family 2 protein [Candidatus Paceibacterota bacterium]
MKSVAVIIPAYNEEDCVDELTSRLKVVFDAETQYTWQALIVENGSTDHTWDRLQKISEEDSRFRILRLSRNFRMDGGLTAGLEYVDSDACVLMTADLQDPPELIPTFLRKWEQGYENIFGVVEERQGTSFLRKLNSRLFYKVAGSLSDGAIPANASDFRLVDRKVYEAVRGMTERNRFVRGLFAWVGFKSIGVPMKRPPRFAGVSNASSVKVIELALKGIFAHSYKPLRFISIFGLLLSSFSFLVMVVLAIIWLFIGVPFAGFGSIIALILFGLGMQALMLGIVSEYLGLVYEEVKGRPNFVVSEKVGF